MALIDELLPASFRGVSFYVVESSVDSGRKQVTHEFPNSDRRFIEDLGRFQNVFRMNALVGGPNYIQNRNALQSALETPGIGLLVHPFFGNVNVVAKQYNLVESINSLGEARFTLTFEKAEESIYPIGYASNLANLNMLADEALELINTDIASLFSLKGNYPNNFIDAQNLIDIVGNAFGYNTRRYTQAANSINKFNNLLDSYKNDKNNLIQNASELGNRTVELFNETNSLISNPSQRVSTYNRFYDFGDTFQKVQPTTIERIQRQSNRDVMSTSIQNGSLVESYRSAAEIDFNNVRQLDQIQAKLEDQYQKLINDNRISDNIKQGLQDLRNESRIFFENERLNTNKISTISTNTQPLTVLTYQYYGSTANVNNLAQLNNIQNNGFVSGNLNILTV